MVVMGHLGAPYGIKGWIRVHPYTEAPDALLGYPAWWAGNAERGEWRQMAVAEASHYGKGVIARFEGCTDRTAALALRGLQIAVRREDLPRSEAGEYYWVDLVGLTVVNLEGVGLGSVSGLLETGANPVLRVSGERERLIPFVESVVREVDLEAGRIRVDWGAEY